MVLTKNIQCWSSMTTNQKLMASTALPEIYHLHWPPIWNSRINYGICFSFYACLEREDKKQAGFNHSIQSTLNELVTIETNVGLNGQISFHLILHFMTLITSVKERRVLFSKTKSPRNYNDETQRNWRFFFFNDRKTTIEAMSNKPGEE